MSLEKIVAVSGKSGLFKIITQTRGGFVAESLVDGKKSTFGIRNNVSVLSDIAIYTIEEEVPLRDVLQSIKEIEEGKPTQITHKASKLELEEYFFKVLPNYDEDRVYASDIKKIIQWYNLLVSKGLDNFAKEDATIAKGKVESTTASNE